MRRTRSNLNLRGCQTLAKKPRTEPYAFFLPSSSKSSSVNHTSSFFRGGFPIDFRAAKFGFFDLDATFSVAFVSLLSECSCPPGSNDGSSHKGLLGAYEILQYFAAHGNLAAARRMGDIDQMCENLGIRLDRDEDEQDRSFVAHASDQHDGQIGEAFANQAHENYHWASVPPHTGANLNALWQAPQGSNLSQPSPSEDANASEMAFGAPLAEGTRGMELTGVIDTDWDMLLQTSFCGDLWEQLCQSA